MSDSFMEDFQEESGTALGEVMELVRALECAQSRVEEAEEHLSDLKTQERILREQTIPQYMAQHRLSELTLDNGRTVSISEELSCAFPKDENKRRAIIDFLLKHEGGDLVKDEIVIYDADPEVLASLTERGITFDRSVSVNVSSLKAWFRRNLGLAKNTIAQFAPNDAPPEVSLYLYRNTKISKEK